MICIGSILRSSQLRTGDDKQATQHKEADHRAQKHKIQGKTHLVSSCNGLTRGKFIDKIVDEAM
jgi:hypothetical protein